MADSKPDARVAFKDSIFSLFMNFTGLQGKRSRVFGLNDPSNGGVHVIIFVACMRLDLGSQTVVLDTAILPLTKSLIPRIAEFLAAISNTKFCSIKVDGKELELWRDILPSFAERCRDWQHHQSCIDTASQRMGDSNDIFCSCSRGSVPADFLNDVPRWSDVAKFATRAAISPMFSVPIVDAPFRIPMSTPSSLGCRKCGSEKAANGGKLLRCSACHDAKYCSSECQQADWKGHKRCCNKQKKERRV
jgi:hypothetical protein